MSCKLPSLDRYRRLSGVLLLAVLLFSSYSGNAQVNEAFVKHLSDQQLQREHFAYLSRYSETDEKVSYLWSKYYLQYLDEISFLENFQKSKGFLLSDTLAFTLANIVFLTTQDSLQQIWYSSFKEEEVDTINRAILLAYRASVDPNNVEAGKLPQDLRGIYAKYLKSTKKKPILAGIFSTAVPGAGKLYSGRRKTSLVAFLAHASYGAQSYESIDKLGISHPFSIFSLSFLGVFYLSNIYGSIRSVKEIRKELRMQLLIDASDYYKFNSTSGLY